MNEIVTILYVLPALFYLFVRLRYELQMMQQNSYRNQRYLKWLKTNILAFERIFDVFLLLTLCVFVHITGYVAVLVSVVLIIKIIAELRKKYKKKLVFTHRAVRLYVTAGIIIAALVFISFLKSDDRYNCLILTIMLLSVLSFAVLLIANIINIPVERVINQRYYNDAQRILKQHKHLVIIGITGSYGKTGTKHYLYRLLSENYQVLMTPGSYNTTMGVVRTIRENLKPYHEIFIVEMGAKQPGDIKEICDLVHPAIGILTSVGEQHLESFKTIENVQKAKFELIDSLPKDGLAVLNYDFEYVVSRKVENVVNVAYYSSSNPDADYYLDEINYTRGGTNFTIKGKNEQPYLLFTKIVGSYHLSNILAAYITAKHLGVDSDAIKYAVSHIEQVEHRLNIKQTSQGITIIDDAFNSNPQGAKMALDVIRDFQTGKRIVVTPGLIELGIKQYDYNYDFGKQIAVSCDYAIIVGLYNREAIINGLHSTKFDKSKIYLAMSLSDAVNHLSGILTVGDVVLYENDLPDTFK
jgi:UDP-N-acetylmuramoyl-tripeptide--D-alanyl-D-alanine ligase